MKFGNYRKLLPKIIVGLVIALFFIFPVFTTSLVTLSKFIQIGFWAIAAMGFMLIMRTGQISLGQAAFMGLGGYTSAVLTVSHGWPFWPGFFLSGIVAGLVALAVGVVAVRAGPIAFSIITLALAEIMRIVAIEWEPVTNGSKGLVTAPPTHIMLGNFEINFATSVVPNYYFILLLVTVTALIFWQIDRGRLGSIFRVIAVNPTLAEHQGIPLTKYKVVAFTVAAVFTGFAGSFYTHFLGVMSPYMFGLWQSIQALMMGIVGGISSLVAGPIIGSVVLNTLNDLLSRLPIYSIKPTLFGAIVLLVLLFLPKGTGLIDLWRIFWNKVYREKPVAVGSTH
jgi:branched-chain amino acid transport system permease protein